MYGAATATCHIELRVCCRAVDLALSVGIFPYVLKLLQTTSQDLRATLVFIWAKILALDKSCQVRGEMFADDPFSAGYIGSGRWYCSSRVKAFQMFTLAFK